MRNSILNLVRTGKGNPLIDAIADGCEKYLRAYYNEKNWDFDTNGEFRVMKICCDALRGHRPVVLDVGAYLGEWSLKFLQLCPDSRIYSFEIIPDIATQLRENVAAHDNITVINKGLSDVDGTIDVSWNKTWPTTNTIHPNVNSPYYEMKHVERISCPISRGDDVVSGLGLTGIDVIKIDTEGHEVSVLSGFSSILRSPQAPRFIQFEYGQTFIYSRRTLCEVYDILRPAGYVVGRIFPNCVDFKPYSEDDETFRMGNYLAVKADDPLVGALSPA